MNDGSERKRDSGDEERRGGDGIDDGRIRKMYFKGNCLFALSVSRGEEDSLLYSDRSESASFPLLLNHIRWCWTEKDAVSSVCESLSLCLSIHSLSSPPPLPSTRRVKKGIDSSSRISSRHHDRPEHGWNRSWVDWGFSCSLDPMAPPSCSPWFRSPDDDDHDVCLYQLTRKGFFFPFEREENIPSVAELFEILLLLMMMVMMTALILLLQQEPSTQNKRRDHRKRHHQKCKNPATTFLPGDDRHRDSHSV